uniref:Uncharacterized protein n=1 Tax=Arion vulgaris TaxID=1028688 RepID=A0A0B7BE88_9EUPU
MSAKEYEHHHLKETLEMNRTCNSHGDSLLRWISESNQKHKRPIMTWRRKIEQELTEMNHSKNTIQRMAKI